MESGVATTEDYHTLLLTHFQEDHGHEHRVECRATRRRVSEIDATVCHQSEIVLSQPSSWQGRGQLDNLAPGVPDAKTGSLWTSLFCVFSDSWMCISHMNIPLRSSLSYHCACLFTRSSSLHFLDKLIRASSAASISLEALAPGPG